MKAKAHNCICTSLRIFFCFGFDICTACSKCRSHSKCIWTIYGSKGISAVILHEHRDRFSFVTPMEHGTWSKEQQLTKCTLIIVIGHNKVNLKIKDGI
jgi:hypothetical protein